MEGKELNLKDFGGGGCSFSAGNSKFGTDLIDRSKVRILLCDNDSKSSDEVLTLLLKCSYQVTSVRSARQVIDALNAEGPDIDIILAEVDLPMKKGMKMLKYITRDKELRRIPVIMMSAQDEVSIVVKCLRLGAADYLVKPLRTNELLNLWTHMWRRRRMLGLAEKGMLNYDFDLVVSDPSDGNTNSTTLFSDDTDDRSRRCENPDLGASVLQEDESKAAAAAADEPSLSHPSEYQPDLPGISDRKSGQLSSSSPKKSQLKIGESSAFFTYVKSTSIKNNPQRPPIPENNGAEENSRLEDKSQPFDHDMANDAQLCEHKDAWDSGSSIPDSLSQERSCTPPISKDFPQRNLMDENANQMFFHQRNNASGLSTQNIHPYYMPGVMNQVLMPSSAQMYQNNMQEIQSNAASIMSQYNHLQQMGPFPYYPVNYCLQPGQMPATHSWPLHGNSGSNDLKGNTILDRREAALMKFRQKRKERCFDKKIRYVNRKKLAERRPRVRGQFVRKVNGVNVDLNGQPANSDNDEDDEEEDDELASRDSSPEDDVS